MSSKPDKQTYGENIEDPDKNIPGQQRKPEQQSGQSGQGQQKEQDRGGEQRGGQQK